MTRFNLVCHGMMLFIDRTDHVTILIPTVDSHLYKFGSPTSVQGVCQVALSDLPAGAFQLTGPIASQKSLAGMVASKDHLLLRQNSFTPVNAAARNVIDIPMPDLVRLYRPVEVQDKTATIFGDTPTSAALEVPAFLHDVVCFSYTTLPDNTLVSLGNLFQVTPSSVGATLCIYAQDVNNTGPDIPHETGVNNLLQTARGVVPNFNLSRVGDADGPPEPAPETGLDRCQLRNLIELQNDISRTGRTGCTAAFLVG
jgi:hypothetical protein